MSGGFKGEVKVVNDADIANAHQALKDQVLVLLERDLLSGVPKDLKVLEQGKVRKEETINISVKVGARVENFEASIKDSLSLMAFKEEDLKELFTATTLKSKLTANNFIEKFESFDYNGSSTKFDTTNQGLILRVPLTGQAVITSKVDVEKLTQEILDKNEVQIKEVLAAERGIEKVKITLWPFWSSKVPANPKKVKIEVD